MIIIQNTKIKSINNDTVPIINGGTFFGNESSLEVYKLNYNHKDWDRVIIKPNGRAYYRNNVFHNLNGPACLSRIRGVVDVETVFFKHSWHYEGYCFDSLREMPNKNIFSYIKVKFWKKLTKKSNEYLIKDFK